MVFEADLISRQVLIDTIESLRGFEKGVASFGSGYKDAEKVVRSICKADECVAKPRYKNHCSFYEPKLDSIADNPNSPTLIACTCKNCGGRLNMKTLVCEFCGTPYKAF